MQNSTNKKFIIITSINHPTKAIQLFSKWKEWQLIVVGDRKSPRNWTCENTIFLGIEEQHKLFGELAKIIPENTYARKMLGYIYAVQHKAEAIFESDDDNIPYDEAESIVNQCILNNANNANGAKGLNSANGWVNIYRRYGADKCWPRGFPIELVNTLLSKGKIIVNSDISWKVMQFLANEDPDVDAIYRMIDGHPVFFDKNKIFSLEMGTYCPFNSQATLWFPEAFPLMFFPLGVPDRVTDILRGYIALTCLWKIGYTLAYQGPIVLQKRNIHNLLNDFRQEFLLYSHADEWSKLLISIKDSNASFLFLSALRLLIKYNFLPKKNIQAYKLFLQKSKEINRKNL